MSRDGALAAQHAVVYTALEALVLDAGGAAAVGVVRVLAVRAVPGVAVNVIVVVPAGPGDGQGASRRRAVQHRGGGVRATLGGHLGVRARDLAVVGAHGLGAGGLRHGRRLWRLGVVGIGQLHGPQLVCWRLQLGGLLRRLDAQERLEVLDQLGVLSLMLQAQVSGRHDSVNEGWWLRWCLVGTLSIPVDIRRPRPRPGVGPLTNNVAEIWEVILGVLAVHSRLALQVHRHGRLGGCPLCAPRRTREKCSQTLGPDRTAQPARHAAGAGLGWAAKH